MKKLITVLAPVVFWACCGMSCFVDQDISTDLVANFTIEKQYPIQTNTSFSELMSFDRNALFANIDQVPENATVKRVDIESIAVGSVPLPQNDADGMMLSIVYLDSKDTIPYFKHQSFTFTNSLDELQVVALNPIAVHALKTQIKNYLNNTGNEDIKVSLKGTPAPEKKLLRAAVLVQIRGAVVFEAKVFSEP